MSISVEPLIVPELRAVYDALEVWILVALRVWAGSLLFLYALRSSFGAFANTGLPVQSIEGTAAYMEDFGWRPGLFWAWLSTINNIVGGLCLALGLLTRPAALCCAVLLFLSAGHHRKDGFFSNQNGVEHYFLWGLVAAFFAVHGGGPISLDHMLGWSF